MNFSKVSRRVKPIKTLDVFLPKRLSLIKYKKYYANINLISKDGETYKCKSKTKKLDIKDLSKFCNYSNNPHPNKNWLCKFEYLSDNIFNIFGVQYSNYFITRAKHLKSINCVPQNSNVKRMATWFKNIRKLRNLERFFIKVDENKTEYLANLAIGIKRNKTLKIFTFINQSSYVDSEDKKLVRLAKFLANIKTLEDFEFLYPFDKASQEKFLRMLSKSSIKFLKYNLASPYLEKSSKSKQEVNFDSIKKLKKLDLNIDSFKSLDAEIYFNSHIKSLRLELHDIAKLPSDCHFNYFLNFAKKIENFELLSYRMNEKVLKNFFVHFSEYSHLQSLSIESDIHEEVIPAVQDLLIKNKMLKKLELKVHTIARLESYFSSFQKLESFLYYNSFIHYYGDKNYDPLKHLTNLIEVNPKLSKFHYKTSFHLDDSQTTKRFFKVIGKLTGLVNLGLNFKNIRLNDKIFISFSKALSKTLKLRELSIDLNSKNFAENFFLQIFKGFLTENGIILLMKSLNDLKELSNLSINLTGFAKFNAKTVDFLLKNTKFSTLDRFQLAFEYNNQITVPVLKKLKSWLQNFKSIKFAEIKVLNTKNFENQSVDKIGFDHLNKNLMYYESEENILKLC